MLPPGAILLLTTTQGIGNGQVLYAFVANVFILSALANSLTIVVVDFLIKISPDDIRPTYSRCFNAITTPVFLLPSSRTSSHRILGIRLFYHLDDRRRASILHPNFDWPTA
jgi:hypothetical protein